MNEHPTIEQYKAFLGTCNIDAIEFSGKAWRGVEDAMGKDYAHAEGFYLGFKACMHFFKLSKNEMTSIIEDWMNDMEECHLPENSDALADKIVSNFKFGLRLE